VPGGRVFDGSQTFDLETSAACLLDFALGLSSIAQSAFTNQALPRRRGVSTWRWRKKRGGAALVGEAEAEARPKRGCRVARGVEHMREVSERQVSRW